MHGSRKKLLMICIYVRLLLYANAECDADFVMQVVQDNLFEWYLGTLNLSISYKFFLWNTEEPEKGMQIASREKKKNNNNSNDEHQTPKRKEKGTKKSMGRAHRFVQRWEKKNPTAVTMLFSLSLPVCVCPSFRQRRKKNELICKWTN